MGQIDWKSVGLKALIGFIVGFASAVATTEDFTVAAIIGGALAGVRFAATVIVDLLSPVVASARKKQEKWFEKAHKII